MGEGRERVLPVLGEDVVAGQVPDGRSAFDQALVALFEILGVDGIGVEGARTTGTVPPIHENRCY